MNTSETSPTGATAVGSMRLLGTGIREPDGSLTCAACGFDCEWTECQAGCDDGYFDGYDEDPLWYDEGDLVPCHECGGQGGHHWCENPKCETQDIRKIISRAQVPNVQSSGTDAERDVERKK